MSTLHDVAKQAGVSPMTVSRVVNGSDAVSPELRERVEQALAETGYMPNTLARSLRARRTDTIALLLPDMTNPFFTTLAHGVETAAREAGLTMILANSDEREDEEQRLVQMLLQRQVDGILVVPSGTGRGHDPAVPRARGPLRARWTGAPAAATADVVRADSEAGAHQPRAGCSSGSATVTWPCCRARRRVPDGRRSRGRLPAGGGRRGRPARSRS